jgi:hypothetical protein
MAYPIKKVVEDSITYIWDGIRKKYLVCTPEEEVRQYLLNYLIEICNYPKAAINIEKLINLGSKKMRYDVMVFVNNEPWLLAECKQPQIELNKDVFYQSLAYQYPLKAKYILLTNGNKTICFDTLNSLWIAELPAYPLSTE